MKKQDNTKIFTIGFTKKNAERFFTLLINNGVKRLVDIRLHTTSQLAGFAKADDLKYFLKAIGNIEYMYLPALAPTQEIFDYLKKDNGDWETYQKKYLQVISERKVERMDIRDALNDSCFLCSEDKPDHCHRKLAAEYLKEKWGNVEIVHLF